VIELIVAFVFVDISVHIGNSGLLLAVAAALVVLAVTAQGPLGIFRVCPPRLHLILVVVVAAMAAVAPVIPALRPDIEGIIVLEFGAVGLIRVATLTDATRPDRAAAVRRRPDTAVIDVTATAAGSSNGEPEPPRPSPAGTTGGPASGDASGAAARWAGRTAAAAATSGRQVVARHRPEAEERVKRTLRSAGRLAGRFTSPSGPDKTGG
jgi:hypothetical protein